MTTPDFLDQPVQVTVSDADGAVLVTVSGVFVVDHDYEDTRTVIVRDEDGEVHWVQPGPDHQVDIQLTN